MRSHLNIPTIPKEFHSEVSNCYCGLFQLADCQFVTLTNLTFPFTGKELDSETGYSYFGARYYDAELSGLFFSVDPMAAKYPNISPYAYCVWNPVKLVDPNGEFGVPTHKRMVKNALKNHTALSKSQQKQIVKATGWYSDLKNGDKPI
ncbi:MAG: RHS repeat-associated core domain-containing protein, partial [Alphaproteobacteria bacterium]|nr:RHS repeat-associated core domain-containing protein [Alphaproteobacteria bacterium]